MQADILYELDGNVLLQMLATTRESGFEVGALCKDGLMVYNAPNLIASELSSAMEAAVVQNLGVTLRIVEKPLSAIITEADLAPKLRAPKRQRVDSEPTSTSTRACI